MSYRLQTIERDFSGFAAEIINETGAMVIKSKKGKNTPIKCSSESEVITYFGEPSSTYPAVFEAIAFCKQAPCWVVSAYADDARYGGIDVNSGSVTAFSTGRDYSTWSYGSSSGSVSHSFFAASPYDDDLAASVKYVSGTQFKLTLYKVETTGNKYLTEYDYSLTREKDLFGKSLYIGDVFDENEYVLYTVNSNYGGYSYVLPGTSVVAFNGGTRGGTPTNTDYNNAWNNFQKAFKYGAKIFMDPLGGFDVKINDIINTYQPYAQGLTIIPIGNDATEAVAARQASAIDSDNICYYTNWARIEDPYNNSSAWISNIGSIGKKFARMYDCYDALSPAGIDENNHGGQLSDWKVLEVENDYTDFDNGLGSDLQILNEAQINPVILDPSYGLMVYGDRTAQVSNSDTSFVGTRRLYNYIIENVTKQILRKQEFKLNDSFHRTKARTMTQTFIDPIVNQSYLREAYVVCDESNNTDQMLELRKFILDIYVKVTPNSQFVILRLTRLSQNQVIADLIK